MQMLTTALRASLVPHRYASATWEGCLALVNHQSAIAAFRARQRPPPPGEVLLALNGYRPPPSNFTPLAASPQYKNGHVLQPHQLDGLNWLLFSWCGMTLRAYDGARAPPPHCRAATSHRLPPLRLAAVRRCHIAVTSPPRCDLFTPRCDLFTASRSLPGSRSQLPCSPSHQVQSSLRDPRRRDGLGQDGPGHRDARPHLAAREHPGPFSHRRAALDTGPLATGD